LDPEVKSIPTTKVQTLATLFRPPIELLFKGTFKEAKEVSVAENKWLLVNIQSITEFNSQRLNRDTWSNPVLSALISENFTFYQVFSDTEEGEKFCQFYPAAAILPYIAIIDPRTGQLMIGWNEFIEAKDLFEQLQIFLQQYSLNSFESFPLNNDSKKKRKNMVRLI